MENTAEKFVQLWQKAKSAYQNSANVKDYESSFEDVLRFLQTLDVPSSYETELLNIFTDPERSVPELLEFCLATLKWTRIKNELIRILNECPDMRTKTCTANVLSAYSDDWDGGEIYRFYQR